MFLQRSSWNVRFAIRLVLGLALVTLSVVVVAQVVPPQLPERHFAVIEGSLSNQAVTFEKVEACGCDAGVHGQSDKKFKFKIVNGSQETLSIDGGRNSSLLLIVEYPNTFHPTVTLPTPASATDQAMTGELPVGASVSLASSTEAFQPLQIAPTLTSQLGVPPGWHAYAIPPTPSGVVEWETNSTTMATYPTYLAKFSLSPGESYSDDRAGWGDWVFPVPVWGALRSMSEESDFTTVLQPDFYDQFYVILGIAAVGSDGRLLGFTAAPPSSTLSDGSEF